MWLAFWYGNRPRYKTAKIYIGDYTLQVPDTLSFIWQFKEIFADESYKFETDVKKPLIYDCGGNIGSSAIYFKKLYPQCQLKIFEADKDIAETLKQNLHTNRISGAEIIAKAVWKDAEGIELSLEGADGGSIYGDSTNKIKIPSVRLKDLLAQEKQVDMLKMDIEGAEFEVLQDCGEGLQKVRNLFVEYHAYQGHPQRLGEILDILQTNGFRYFIYNPLNRLSPLINRRYKNQSTMDLQLNIHAWRE